MDWENYTSEYQRIVDDETVEKDCTALQDMFDVAANFDDRQRERIGDGNADLMGYIDEALRIAGCYE